VSISLKKPKWLGSGALALVAGAAFLASVTTPARAVQLPGSALFGYYDVSEPPTPDFGTGTGDSILTLVNPNGNSNFSFGRTTDECAMIYVFDDDQEMGECCGCPLTPAQLATFSFRHNLTADWGISGVEGADNGSGTIAIRAASINAVGCESFANPGTISPACNGGCDPTNGYAATPTLLGSITHVQRLAPHPSSVTEVSLFDNGTGDPMNNTYLIQQCAALVGNGSGGGICTCPTE
jgi:hypothetical protein